MKKLINIFIYLSVALLGYNIHSVIENLKQYKINTAKYDVASYIKAINLFHEDFAYYPDYLEDLFKKPDNKNLIVEWPSDGYFRPNIKPQLAAPKKDPWGDSYIYEIEADNKIFVYSKNNDIKNIDASKEETYKIQAENILEIIYRSGLFIVFAIIALIALMIFSSEFFNHKKNKICECEDFYEILKEILRYSFDKETPASLLLHKISLEISRIFPVMRCAIILIKDAYSAVSIASQDNPELIEFDLNLLNYPELIQMISMGETLVVDQLDVVTNTHMLAGVKELLTGKGIKAILCEPIINENKIIGSVFIRTCADKKTFNPEEIELIQLISKIIKPLLKKHPRYKNLF